MKRRVLVRRDTNSGDPIKQAYELGRELGVEEGTAAAAKSWQGSVKRASADARQMSMSKIAELEATIRDRNAQIEDLLETITLAEHELAVEGPRRRRPLMADTKDWIAEFKDRDAPYSVDES